MGGGRIDWHRNEVTLREEGYATHLIADDAIRQIEHRDRDRPLFLYVAFSAPHLPNEAPAETVSRYADIEDGNRRVYAAMVDEMDQTIGAILAALEEARMTDDTLVWFMSDNGGTHRKYSRDRLSAITRMLEDDIADSARTRLLEFIRSTTQDGGGDNGPYQGGKGTLGEGGVLVPSVVSWPGHFPSRPLSQRITVQDILPTLTAIAGPSRSPINRSTARTRRRCCAAGRIPAPSITWSRTRAARPTTWTSGNSVDATTTRWHFSTWTRTPTKTGTWRAIIRTSWPRCTGSWRPFLDANRCTPPCAGSSSTPTSTAARKRTSPGRTSSANRPWARARAVQEKGEHMKQETEVVVLKELFRQLDEAGTCAGVRYRVPTVAYVNPELAEPEWSGFFQNHP